MESAKRMGDSDRMESAKRMGDSDRMESAKRTGASDRRESGPSVKTVLNFISRFIKWIL